MHLSTRTVINSDRFTGMQSQRPAPLITIVTTNPTRADNVVTTIHQFCLHVSIHVRDILSFFSKEKVVASLILRAHTLLHWQFLYASPPLHTSSFPMLVHLTSLQFFVPVHHYTVVASLC